jgi:hypothetical protein
LASRLITVAMLPLCMALSIDVYVLAGLIFESRVDAAFVALVLFSLFFTLWFVFPRLAQHQQEPHA